MGFTLARPTWRRMKNPGAMVHCARAVHVQVVSAFSQLNARTWSGRNGRAPRDLKLAGHMILCQLKIHWGATSVGCRLHAPGAENLFDEGVRTAGSIGTLS